MCNWAGKQNSQNLGVRFQDERDPNKPLPEWCKPVGQWSGGPWHTISDDEYSDESPYLMCGSSTSQRQPSSKITVRRTAHTVKGDYTILPPCPSL